MSWKLPPTGLRREVSILLPVALLLLVVLSAFTLFSYRDAVVRLAGEHREQAIRAARRAAGEIGRGEPAAEAVRRLSPDALRVLVVDSRGTVLAAAGEAVEDPFAPFAGRPPRPAGVGPSEAVPDAVAGIAPLALPSGERAWVRVDLPTPTLAAQRRSLGVLTWVVLGLDAALGLLLLLYLRHLLSPYERLLARAREVEPGSDPETDETAFLISTFERAAAALAAGRSRPADGIDSDLAALERTLASSLESGAMLLDVEGAVLALNPTGAGLLSVPPPPPGTPLAAVTAGHRELHQALDEAVGQHRGVRRREIGLDGRADGRVLGLSVHPLRRDDGAVRAFLVLFADLTESKRLAEESRLAEGLAQLGELAAGVAHELRNGLATLSGYLTLIERRPGEESVADYLDEMRQETRHLERVLADFLAFARPGSARVEDVPLLPLLLHVAADPALGGRVEVACPPDAEVTVSADPHLLERALKNLLHNAVEAASAGPDAAAPVTLSAARTDGGGILIAVEDRGPGVPAELEERLFQPFVSGRPGGVGLGLALAHRIVTLHGGRLALTPREGGGTSAEITLPPGRIVTEGSKAVVREPAPAPPESS